MRFERIDLARYGRFTERRLELPAGELDFHLVYGPNEAGKSTAQSAIDDLLFGFAHSTPYDFLHDKRSLRVGAVLERGGARLELARRKGNKDTLRDASDAALGDEALLPFVGRVERDFYRRMFSLDNARLRQGGRTILEAGDDVGRMLFEAGAGLSGLGELARTLEKEAEGIYARRASGNRTFYVERERFREAERRRNEATVLARAFREARRLAEEKAGELAKLDEEVRGRKRDKARLERIERVLPVLARIERHQEEMAALGELPVLPDGAAADLDDAERRVATTQSTLDSLAAEVRRIDEKLEGLPQDDALLARGEAIAELSKRRSVIEKAQGDLPRREAELSQKKERVAELLAELGRAPRPLGDPGLLEAAAALVPTRARIEGLRRRIAEWSGLDARKRAADGQIARRRDELERHRARLAERGPAPDPAPLAAALRFARARGDLRREIAAREAAIRERAERLERLLAGLRPLAPDERILAPLAVPQAEQVADFAGRLERLSERRRELEARARQAEAEAREARLSRDQSVRDGGAVPAEELRAARHRRDLGWRLLRRKHLLGEVVPDEELRAFTGGSDLADAFERAQVEADDVADRRFARAEASALLVGIGQRIEKLELRLTSLADESAALEEERARWEAGWREAWRESGLEPDAPQVMLRFLEARARALDLVAERREEEARLAGLRADESEAVAGLSAALAAFGTGDRIEGQPLLRAVEIASERERALAEDIAERRGLTKALAEAEAELEAQTREAREADEALERWRRAFSAELSAIGRPPGEEAGSAGHALSVLDELREVVQQARSLEDRIGKMRDEAGAFELAAAALARELGPEGAPRDALRLAAALQARLDEMKSVRTERATLLEQRERIEGQARKAEAGRAEARATIAHLLALSGCDSVEDLRRLLDRVRKGAALRAVLDEETAELDRAGAGRSIDGLRAECRGIDADGLRGSIEALDAAIDALGERLKTLSVEEAQARGVLERIAGGADAASAEADRARAVAGMQEQAERYLRLYASARLLRWAIERYRRDKQAPLLARASSLFRALTLGAFDRLVVDADERDRPVLLGVRADGSHLDTAGMSDGTLDQLYLALRVAAVEDYLRGADPLPFVADDLFIHFDDARAAAGFRVLGELARRTQVLFFTHHAHLRDVAEAALAPVRLARHTL